MNNLSAKQVSRRLAAAAVSDQPRVLADLHATGQLSRATARLVLPQVWGSNRQPVRALPRAGWIDLFDHAGFHCFPASVRTPPVLPRWLYRGSSAAGADGLSWTSSLDVAAYYASNRASKHTIWTVEAPRSRWLAYYPGWSEYLVDVDGLDLTEHPDVDRLLDRENLQRIYDVQSCRTGVRLRLPGAARPVVGLGAGATTFGLKLPAPTWRIARAASSKDETTSA